jgi:hypothetical protein
VLFWDEIKFEVPCKKEPVYVWQWLVKHRETSRYSVTEYCKTQQDAVYDLNVTWDLLERIEGSKKEVK